MADLVFSPDQLKELRADLCIANAVTAGTITHADLTASLARAEAAKRDAADPRVKVSGDEYRAMLAHGTDPAVLKGYRIA